MSTKLARRVGWTINRENLAWAAGFIDGEGSFYLQSISGKERPNRPWRPRFEIGQINTEVLYKLQDTLGFGAKVLGPYDNKKHPEANAKPVYVYYLSGFADVQALLALVWIWLGPVKRQQAKSVLLTSIKGE